MKVGPSLLVLVSLSRAAGAIAPAASAIPAYEERAVSRSDGDVRISVAVLSAAESEAVYGVALAGKAMQPVWIEVENRSTHAYWLMSPGLDPNFFPVSEAAEAFSVRGKEADDAEREQRFRRLAFRNPVPPGRTVSGFVLTNLHEGAKLVQVDLFASEHSRTFSVVAVVPGLRADYERNRIFEHEPFPPDQIVDFTDDEAFRNAIESLPCCVFNDDGTKTGDPLNLVVVGGIDDAFPAFVRRGWSPTETIGFGSVTRMVTSALSGDRYPYAPVSNLYLFDRPQDIALQKARDTIHQRNHLRLWKSPMRYHGQQVWVGQISRDIGSRLTIHSPTLTTHKIDPDVDKAVLALLGDMVYSQNLRKMAFAGGIGAATRDAPRRNLTGDPWYTRGLRAVLFFDRSPTPITAIEILPWRTGGDGLIETAADEAAP